MIGFTRTLTVAVVFVLEQRGRRVGYQNDSVKQQLLLCDVMAEFKPKGRNMWETMVAAFNASKKKWPTRDYNSLRRKFRIIYAKPKPTGNQVSQTELVALLTHEIQAAIEKKGGVHTSHDGRDTGRDDALLLKTLRMRTSRAGAKMQREVEARRGRAQSSNPSTNTTKTIPLIRMMNLKKIAMNLANTRSTC